MAYFKVSLQCLMGGTEKEINIKKPSCQNRWSPMNNLSQGLLKYEAELHIWHHDIW